VDTKRYELNVQLAQMLKGGVIMDVTNVEQAKIAEEAGAVSVMALERVPADIRKDGGVARMSDPSTIATIKKPYPSRLWQKPVLVILLKRKFWKLCALII